MTFVNKSVYSLAVDKTQFGTIIREARSNAGLSLRRVAAETGIDFTRLSRIENGTRPAPPLAEIRPLAALLQLDMVDLLVAAGVSREIVEHLLWSERLQAARTDPRWQEYIPDSSMLQSKNTFAVKASKREGARCLVKLGSQPLTVLSFSPQDSLLVRIPPPCILVARAGEACSCLGIENILSMKLKKLREIGQIANLVLSAEGFELNAVQTCAQVESMALRAGDNVKALIPVTAIETSPQRKEN